MWSPQSAASGCGSVMGSPQSAADDIDSVMWSPQSAADDIGSVMWSPQSAADDIGSVMWSPQSAADDICSVMWSPQSAVRACGSVMWSPQSAVCGLRQHCVVTTNSFRRIAAALCGRNIPSAAVAVIIPFKLPWFNISLFLVLYTLYIYAREGGAVSPASRRRPTRFPIACPCPSWPPSMACCRKWCAGQRQ